MCIVLPVTPQLLNMEKENVDVNAAGSAMKKRCLSLSLKKNSRFTEVSEETVECFACASLTQNSALNGKWAMRNLSKWLADHNKRHPESPCPPEILSSSCPKDVLSKWLPVVVWKCQISVAKCIHRNMLLYAILR